MRPSFLRRSALRALIASAAIAGLQGCEPYPLPVDEVPLDVQLRAEARIQGLTGDPASGRNLPDVSDPLAQLGAQLFFTKGLGGDLDAACVTCHHPVLGGGDSLSLSIGVEAEIPDLLGRGRRHKPTGTHYDGGPTVPRNAPTTFNIGLWDSALFHDGRAESLDKLPGSNGAGPIRTPDSPFGVADPEAGPNLPTAQARFPVTSPEEMRGFGFVAGGTNAELRAALERRLQGVDPGLPANGWLALFRQALGVRTGLLKT